MKKSLSDQIIVCTLLLVSFLVQSPLRATVLNAVFTEEIPFLTILFPLLIRYVALFLCLVVALKRFMGVASFLKTALLTAAILLVDNLSLGRWSLYAVAMLRPIIAVAAVWFAFWWITKTPIKPSKIIVMLIGAFYILEMVFAVLEYNRITNFSGGGVLDLVTTVAFDQSVFSVADSLLFYLQLATSFIYLMTKMPEKPMEKQIEIEETMTEIPADLWRCMGCGKILSEEEDRCECGYKR